MLDLITEIVLVEDINGIYEEMEISYRPIEDSDIESIRGFWED